MKVFITQEHIDKGVKSNCTECPTALAILEQCEVDTIEVGSLWVEVRRNCALCPYELDMPSSLKRFIEKFDDGKLVTPIEFEIDLPKRVRS